MANLATAFEEARTVQELGQKYWDDYAFDNNADLGAGAALLEEIAANATSAALDLRAADKALTKTRA